MQKKGSADCKAAHIQHSLTVSLLVVAAVSNQASARSVLGNSELFVAKS